MGAPWWRFEGEVGSAVEGGFGGLVEEGFRDWLGGLSVLLLNGRFWMGGFGIYLDSRVVWDF